MSEPIRMRARLVADGLVEVHVLMPHPMETGLRKDASGLPVPAHYITDMRVRIAEQVVLEARMGMAVSQDPLLSFRCRGARSGDRLRVTWTDNQGQQRADETLIA